jgi:hypothetical protein
MTVAFHVLSLIGPFPNRWIQKHAPDAEPGELLGSMIDWTSDSRSQGYTNLQRLAKCLDHRKIHICLYFYNCSRYSMQSSKVVLGCVMH